MPPDDVVDEFLESLEEESERWLDAALNAIPPESSDE
jgi:hypothetical protein